MSEHSNTLIQGRRSIVRLFALYIGISSILFFFVVLLFFIPLMNSSFDVLEKKSSKQLANYYASTLSSYLHNRILVLHDVASTPIVVNSVLQGDKESAALADFMHSVRLLGEDPLLTLVDVNGNVLVSEVPSDRNYAWTKPLLNQEDQLVNFIIDNAGSEQSQPLFDLAVPIIYGNGREGVIVARINAAPKNIYADTLKDNSSAVQYMKGDKIIHSGVDSIISPVEHTVFIDSFDIRFAHIVSEKDVIESKQALLFRLFLGALVSAIVMFIGLFFIGRKAILQPYVKLATLQNTIAKAVEGISFIDPSGCYVSLNHAYAAPAGYLPEELEGQPWSVTVFPEDLPMLNEAYQAMLDEGMVVAEARGLHKDGSIFYKQVTMITQYDEQGEMIGHHCFMKDITARKKAEQELDSALRFQSLIFESIPDLLFVKDSEYRIVQANPAFLNVYPENIRDTVIGTTTLESYAPDEVEEFLTFDKQAFVEGFSRVEESICFPDGIVRTLDTQKVRFTDNAGDTFILGVARDVTDIRVAEKALKVSEQRYEVAVAGSSVGLWDYNLVTEELYWSDRFKAMVGVSDIDFVPTMNEFSDRLHPDDKEKTLAALQSHIDNKIPYEVEYQLRKNDGDYIWVHAEGQVLWDEKGVAIRVAGSVEDVTERKKAEAERERLIEKLVTSNEELEHFAFVCSHDLQEPLRIIRSFSERLQQHIGDTLKDDEKATKYFAFIMDGAARAQVLIADILTYSRVDSGTQALEEVNVRSLVDAVKSHLQLDDRNELGCIFCGELPCVVGNRTQLYQLFQNLINNGLKYQPAGRLPEVYVDAVEGEDEWQFSIKDNGIGIEPKYQQQIFRVFKRLHGQGEYAGTGIGLAICKKVVARHGGRLWVESEKDKGATFFFTLPKLGVVQDDVIDAQEGNS